MGFERSGQVVSSFTSIFEDFCGQRLPKLFAVGERAGVERPLETAGAMATAFFNSLVLAKMQKCALIQCF
jgi:hypothetical protein